MARHSDLDSKLLRTHKLKRLTFDQKLIIFSLFLQAVAVGLLLWKFL